MLKKYISLISLALCLYACSSVNQDVCRIENPDYAIVSDSLYTSMPGSLFVGDGYVLWTDPFADGDFLHILDKETGKELAAWGSIGGGSQEFYLPMISYSRPPYVQIFDMNKNLQVRLNIERISADSLLLTEEWSARTLDNCTQRLQLDDDAFLSFFPDKPSPFRLDKGNRADVFGKLPLEEKVENGFDKYQGEIVYSDGRRSLLYSTYLFPYVALYEYKDDRLILKWEKGEYESCHIKNGNLTLDRDVEPGMHAVALTKDYIVGVRRDKDVEGELPGNANGRDMRMLPQSLFVYNYDFELQKIINLKVPIVRLAGDDDTNEVCLLVADPEFRIIKLPLP